MTCFHPLKAFRSQEVNPETGKRGITFNSKKALVEGSMIKLPCGQCSGCRANRAHEWALRCDHEAKSHDCNSFVTLTYDDENVPQDFSVKLRDWQLFLKRLRKRAAVRIRYFGCGEYGEQTLRPHYHGLLFGFDFADKKLWSRRDGYQVFKSEMLSDLWPFGMSEIGSVTYQSGGYVARYCLKKMTGDRALDHYCRVSPIDGQVHQVLPEFATMSLKPGIGTQWFQKFGTDAFPSDFLIVDGRKVRPPAYYLRQLDDAGQEAIKRARKRRAADPAQRWNSTRERLAVREVIHEARLKRLVKSL